jgi:YVTN family beta-propeller protein
MSRNNLWTNRLFAGALAAGLSIPMLAQSVQFPTYSPGPQTNGTYIVSDGTIITPYGAVVNLGIRVRAKAVAVNPTGNHTAAVLTMGTSASDGNGPVEIFDTQTGAVLQSYLSNGSTDASGSAAGIAYTPDGKYLIFSQDYKSGSAHVTVANVNPTTGLLTDDAHIAVPVDGTSLSIGGVGSTNELSGANSGCYAANTVTFPVSGQVLPAPVGTTGSLALPCGWTYSYDTSYPTGIAVAPPPSGQTASTTAYAVLDVNNTLAQINLTNNTLVTPDLRVGNLPNSVVISADGTTAYVSNEGGNPPAQGAFQLYSDGTTVAAQNPTGAIVNGSISVVNLSSFTVTNTISVGHHPTGMAWWGSNLLVSNTYDDTISVINTSSGTVSATINLGLPIKVPGATASAYGAGPNSISVNNATNTAYVALYNANAVAVVNLTSGAVEGMIPVSYAPASVVYDSVDNALIVANDKGWGTTGNPSTCNPPGPANPTIGATVPGAPTTSNSCLTEFGATALNTHQDLGTVSIVPIPDSFFLSLLTKQVALNNHWDLAENIKNAAGGSGSVAATAIPAKIGDPSLIKHVFLIIRENRTYDQVLGDIVGGNGDPSLAVFGDETSVTGQVGAVTPNVHALMERFPLLDNYYNPSRQSADGHNWILQAMAPYSDDIQSPDWERDYPSNGGDAIAYQNKGHLFDVAAAAGVSMKIYGEYVEENTFSVPGCNPTTLTPPLNYITDACEPTWSQFFQDSQDYENLFESELYYYNDVGSYSPLPNVMNYAVQRYPQFDLNIPDQYRVDVWEQDFANDVKNGTVPQFEMMWISSDHTGGPPTAQAMQADNDLAVGRFVDIISHSPIWATSAIFITEDDAQTGVDHVDGHRSPGYVISPFVKQHVNDKGEGTGVLEEKTFYTQVNMTRTIEQILGLTPMNQNDLVASPMTNLFTNTPSANALLPWTHVPNQIALDTGVSPTSVMFQHDTPAVHALRTGWMKKKTELFAGKYHIPDSEDPDTVNHLIWYESTGFSRPFPGEKTVRPASEFNRAAPTTKDEDDD